MAQIAIGTIQWIHQNFLAKLSIFISYQKCMKSCIAVRENNIFPIHQFWPLYVQLVTVEIRINRLTATAQYYYY